VARACFERYGQEEVVVTWRFASELDEIPAGRVFSTVAQARVEAEVYGDVEEVLPKLSEEVRNRIVSELEQRGISVLACVASPKVVEQYGSYAVVDFWIYIEGIRAAGYEIYGYPIPFSEIARIVVAAIVAIIVIVAGYYIYNAVVEYVRYLVQAEQTRREALETCERMQRELARLIEEGAPEPVIRYYAEIANEVCSVARAPPSPWEALKWVAIGAIALGGALIVSEIVRTVRGRRT